MSRTLFTLVLIGCVLPCAANSAQDPDHAAFVSNWADTHDRVWIGSEFWANPMEDWRIAGGRLECTAGATNRNVHILTRQIGARDGTFEMSVEVGLAGRAGMPGNAGFHVGIQDEIDDYRARTLRGSGIFAGLTTTGEVLIGPRESGSQGKVAGLADFDSVRLRVHVKQTKVNQQFETQVALTVTVGDSGEPQTFRQTLRGRKRLSGNIALAQNLALPAQERNRPRFWFRKWSMKGPKLDAYEDQKFGPILWAMHTLSDSRGDDGYVLKMTAQMPPLGADDSQTVRLQLREDDQWKTIQEQPIDPVARTARFRIQKWDATRGVSYRLAYTVRDKSGQQTFHHFAGTVRRDPVDRDVKVAGFTGNTDSGFPNREVERNVTIHDPDVLFFSGDQIYERVGGYGIIRAPVDRAVLNYLRKWYLLGWAFRDLMRDRVTICLPDDHDVYQGNIWGNGGNSVPSIREHQQGGYAQHRDFVNAVHRTQTSHHPDLFDSTPVKQNISVFYGDMVYGRVSFAIIADRMFKSGPTKVATWPGRPDHLNDPSYDVRRLDKPGVKLLGDRQLKFLNHWAADWRSADVKCVLSQTIFCNLANYHGHDKEFIYADLDSNGWPQTGRRRALDAMRKGFAFHYAGDQHLPSIVHHGLDEFSDAGFSFCVPSIAAGYPRSWRPDDEGRAVENRPDDGLPNTGNYWDGFRNKMTVHAIGNPEPMNRPGRLRTLHDKASGFGLVTFHKEKGEITIDCYRLLIDAANPQSGDQFAGWPKTIRVKDNYGRKAAAWLPTLEVTGLTNPVVQVVQEDSGDVVYTIRIRGNKFQPHVFAPGKYQVKVGDPDSNVQHILTGVAAKAENQAKQQVRFRAP